MKSSRPQTAFKPSNGKYEEQQLFISLKELIAKERKIEVQKQKLTSQKDYHIFDIFRIFDYKGKQSINF